MVGVMTPEIREASFCISARAARGSPQLATCKVKRAYEVSSTRNGTGEV